MCISKTRRFATVAAMSLLLSVVVACRGDGANRTTGVYWVVPVDEQSETDQRWADYVISHIQPRLQMGGSATSQRPKRECTRLELHVDSDASHSWAISEDGETLRLTARDDATMVWLIYQFFASTERGSLSAADLPPAVVPLKTSEGDFAFEYRGLYTPFCASEDQMDILAAHNVDYDWGLWGHNLKRVFAGKVPSAALAQVGGATNSDQFCFTADDLYRAIETYIVDNFGEGAADDSYRFGINPNDNDIVCQCSRCREAGNTASSATPAVSQMLERLAKRFPHHSFFTTAYITTKEAPQRELPANTGVLVSAIDLPMRAARPHGAAANRFEQTVRAWQTAVGRIYVWDYMRNYDDYLTPYPCLAAVAERLRFYQNIGVRGVFFNGSAPDYASFDDVQSAALAALMVDPALDPVAYARQCMERWYPKTGRMLADAYCGWEQTVTERRATLPFYGGIGDALNAWMGADDMDSFCRQLDAESKTVKGEERAKLNPLLTALQFTRLELMRSGALAYNADLIADCIASLEGHKVFEEMNNYREALGPIDEYLASWRTLRAENAAPKGALHGMEVADADGRSGLNAAALAMLTDGLHALATDYHTGWALTNSRSIALTIPAGKVRSGQTLTASFLDAKRWRIRAPRSVEAFQGDRLVGKADIAPGDGTSFAKIAATMTLSNVDSRQPLTLRIAAAEAARQTACDEIMVY